MAAYVFIKPPDAQCRIKVARGPQHFKSAGPQVKKNISTPAKS